MAKIKECNRGLPGLGSIEIEVTGEEFSEKGIFELWPEKKKKIDERGRERVNKTGQKYINPEHSKEMIQSISGREALR